jgi:hypothetical protein
VLLLLKIIVVPALIISVTLAGRRWGPRVGGVLASFPLVAGPVLFFLATEQGEVFAAEAARATLVSLIAVAASGLAYAWACLRASWWMSLAASWGSFTLLVLTLHRVHWAAFAAFAAALASFMLARALLPSAREGAPPATRTAWDLPLRMISAVALVLTTTALARRLGPTLSGALTPFPIALTILMAFTHVQQGPPTTIRFLRGFFPGMWSFAAFCLVTTLALAPLGKWLGFALALASVIPIQMAVLWWGSAVRTP